MYRAEIEVIPGLASAPRHVGCLSRQNDPDLARWQQFMTILPIAIATLSREMNYRLVRARYGDEEPDATFTMETIIFNGNAGRCHWYKAWCRAMPLLFRSGGDVASAGEATAALRPGTIMSPLTHIVRRSAIRAPCSIHARQYRSPLPSLPLPSAPIH
jgi:hypothetical protein